MGGHFGVGGGDIAHEALKASWWTAHEHAAKMGAHCLADGNGAQ